MKSLISLSLLILTLFVFKGQDLYSQVGFLKDVWPGYQGWVGDPDTITVKILPGCSHDDSVAIINSINTWNAMDSDPKFKLVSSGSAQVTIKKDDNLKGRTGTTEHRFASDDQNLSTSHERTGAAVTFDSNNGVSVQQIVTHELGHCLGLRDVDDPKAVMRRNAYTGASSTPSKHDTTQIDQAFIQSASSYGVRQAEDPQNAILPGTDNQLRFNVDDLIPSGSYNGAICMADPIDPDIYVEMVYLDSISQSLFISVYVMPDHPNGQFYLLVTILLPESDNPINFLGMHFVNINPVPPIAFECPMDIYIQDGWVHIDWVDNCTYPFSDSLRSFLTVDTDSDHYCMEIYDDNDYALDLNPDEYIFTLHVDDYQVNSASSYQNFILTDVETLTHKDHVSIWPNPFTDKCYISLKKRGRIRIVDMNGKLVEEFYEKSIVWEPSETILSGIYFIQATVGDQIFEGKVVYRKY